MILYLHGLNSSPVSHKARLLAARMADLGLADQLRIPALHHDPAQAMADVERLLADAAQPVTLLGSSLGGFYATWLAEKHGLKAVLVNPAVEAPQLARNLLGPQKNYYSGAEWLLTETHAAALDSLEVGAITRPERYLLLLESGDEVLDWRRAVEKFRDARQIVVEGGDHGFASFATQVDTILRFAGLTD
ncbi:MAG: esterase [Sulfuricella sp.]|nr:esterase [Sulfuricella sp.]